MIESFASLHLGPFLLSCFLTNVIYWFFSYPKPHTGCYVTYDTQSSPRPRPTVLFYPIIPSRGPSYATACLPGCHVRPYILHIAFHIYSTWKVEVILKVPPPHRDLLSCSFKCSCFHLDTQLYILCLRRATNACGQWALSQNKQSCYCKVTRNNLRVAMRNLKCYPPRAVSKSLSRSGWKGCLSYHPVLTESMRVQHKNYKQNSSKLQQMLNWTVLQYYSAYQVKLPKEQNHLKLNISTTGTI
jgi:hypothetical protein